MAAATLAALAATAAGVIAVMGGLGFVPVLINSASPAGDGLPRVLDVRCGGDGAIAVSGHAVAGSSDGVHVRAINTSGGQGIRLSYRDHYGFSVSLPAPTGGRVYMLPVPPGEASLQCLGPGSDSPGTATVDVADPDGLYEDVDAAAVLGCVPEGMGSVDGPVATGETAADAARAAMAEYAPLAVVTPASGYVDDPERGYLVGSPTISAYVDVGRYLAGGGYSAVIGANC